MSPFDDAKVEFPSETEATLESCRVRAPRCQTAPLVFASPHSGRAYPDAFLAASRLDPLALRRSEDAFMDKVFAAAPAHGAPLLCAHFPRAYVDANRELYELDPAMFDGPLPAYVTTKSPRITAGLGTIPRVVANGEEIYGAALRFTDAKRRIEACHRPYHSALERLVEATLERFGVCLLVDCHSMPSVGGLMDCDLGRARVDVVLGDCHGRASAPEVSDAAETALRALGFRVTRNTPYAGGFTTRHYGRPRDGVHALQIEVNRAIYMDEAAIAPTPGLAHLAERMGRFVNRLARIDLGLLAAA